MPDDHITVFGLGIEKASELLWSVMTNHLTNTPSYMGLRDGFIAEAITRYGECSFERVQVQNAWAGVGVGPEYGPDIEVHGAKTYCVDNSSRIPK